MKKFLLPIAAMLLSMTACNKDNEGILKLEVEQYTSDAKAHLDNGNFVVWDNNDTVKVNGNDHLVAVDGTSASLTDVAESAEGYKAIYPASWADATCSHIDYPETQVYRTNSEGKQIVVAPMVAYTDGSDVLKFKNVGSILAIDVTNSSTTVMNVQKIEITNSETDKINGHFIIDNITTTPSIRISWGSSAGSTTTTLKCSGVIIPVGESKTFYVAMPTHYNVGSTTSTFSPRLNIKVYDDNNIYSKVQTSTHTLEANHGYTAPITSDDNPTPHPLLPNQIKYVTSDNSALVGYNQSAMFFGGEPTCDPVGITWSTLGLCTSNIYYGSYGIITFANPITTMGETMSSGGDFTLFYDNSHYNYLGSLNITDLFLPEGVTSLEEWTFSCKTYTGTISLPSTMTTIPDCALNNKVSRLEMHSTTPPTITTTAWTANIISVLSNTVLHVPAGSGAAYAASTWNQYFGAAYGVGTRIVDDL